MKRFLLFMMLLSGCQVAEFDKTEKKRVCVLSSTAMIDDLVGRIGKDRIHRMTLITGQMDPHSYELVKGDDEKIVDADLIFLNGLGLEHGASLQHKIHMHSHLFLLGDIIADRFPGTILYEDRVLDPHIWMDVSLWALAIDPIVEALIEIDPEGKVEYEKNGEEAKVLMESHHKSIVDSCLEIPEDRRFLVTSHDAFQYFTRAYLALPQERANNTWQRRFIAPEGLSPEGQLSAISLKKVVEYIELHQIQVVFPETNLSRDALRKIASVCQNRGMDVRISSKPLYGDTMGKEGSIAGTYLGMMNYNADCLKKELTWKRP